MLVVVTYDIADDKRRTKLAAFLEGYGRRVQESVFECFLTLPELKPLYERVLQRVDPAEDNVRFYWLTRQAMGQSLAIGGSPPTLPPETYVV